jgi:DegV family protein with EDD domain
MDDAGDVPQELVDELKIIVVPVNIAFGTEEFLSGISMDHASFYEKVKQVSSENFPKTSQPTPYQFEEVYKKLFFEGESEILTITVGEKLSGTYASAEAAAKELEGQGSLYLFDSMGGSAAEGYMAVEAARMAQEGKAIKQILSRLEEMREKQAVVFLIDSLEYAVKGGRISSWKSTMVSLLNIKPIMKLEDGLIVEAAKVRTYKKALDYIVDLVHQQTGSQPCRLAYIHAGALEKVPDLQSRAAEKLNISEEIVTDMAVSVAINLGPGALGIVAVPA